MHEPSFNAPQITDTTKSAALMASYNIAPKLVTLPSGVQLYTERITSKNAPANAGPSSTFVFAHGLGGSTNMFFSIFDELLFAFPSATLLAFDHSGTSNSPAPVSLGQMEWSFALKNVEELLAQEVPTGPIVFIAHSASTFLASQFFLTSSSPTIPRITHAVLIGGPMNSPIPAPQVEFLTKTADTMEKFGASAIIDPVMTIWTGKTTAAKRPNTVALTRALFLSQRLEPFSVLFHSFVKTVGTTHLPLENFPRSMKVLIVYGLEDEVISKEVMELVTKRIPGAKLSSLLGVGHSPQIEDPEATAAVILDFLKQ